MKSVVTLMIFVLGVLRGEEASAQMYSYAVVDTGQAKCYDNEKEIPCPKPGQPFYGQDAQYRGLPPAYRDNGDGTVTDLNTGLMWQKKPNLESRLTYREALEGAKTLRLGGYNDWRLQTIKELYSLIDLNGNSRTRPPVPYIDTRFFDFRFGDISRGERLIDAQYWSSTEYVGLTMHGNATVFGVNFADGRIKGYPRDFARHFVRYVRGNPEYGKNKFVDNGDGTISDHSTGLMWAKNDSGKPLNWEEALAYCSHCRLAGYTDWRLPNAKELHTIVDYTRAPDALDPARRGPAIDPIFQITDPEGWFWTSTTHLEGDRLPGGAAVYIAFGRAMGFMLGPDGQKRAMNVHGAGAQRSDPKAGNPSDFPEGRGPQGDEVRIYNYVRCVRGGPYHPTNDEHL